MGLFKSVGLSFLVLCTGCIGSEKGTEDLQPPPGIRATVTFRGREHEARAVQIDSTYFDSEKDRAWIGRLPLQIEFRPGGGHVAVLSHRLWTDLGGTPDIVGERIDAGGKSRVVIGITTPQLSPEERSIVWTQELPGSGTAGLA